jgi:hypothetical protein
MALVFMEAESRNGGAMSMRTAEGVADPIARHVSALAARLDGPRRAKADMLREVRHGLHDAADAHREAGATPDAAAAAAVAEFGDPAELAGDFQIELAARQSRHALAFLTVVGPVTEVTSRILWSNAPMPVSRPPDLAFVLADVMDVLSWGLSIVAAVLLVGCGLGARWIDMRARFTRFVGYGVIAKISLSFVGGVALTLLFNTAAASGGLQVWTVVQNGALVAMWGYAGWLTWRCLRVARQAEVLRDGRPA